MNCKILKQKNFLFLIIGQFISLIGTGMQKFSLSLYVLSITGSTTQFASTLAIALIPTLILGPINGVLVDWFDKKKIVVYSDFFCGFLILTYFFIYKINDGLGMIHIYLLLIILSIIDTLFKPAINVIIPSIMKKNDLVDANSINSLVKIIPQILSPIIAAILFSLSSLYFILLINGLSFLFSAFLELFIKIPNVQKNIKKSNKKLISKFKLDFLEGIIFIKSKNILLSLSILGLIVNFAATPIFSIGFIHISKNILLISDIQFALLNASFVIAMIISSFVASHIFKKIPLEKIYSMNLYLISILIFLMSAIPSSYYLNLFNSNLIPYLSLILIGFLLTLISSIGNIGLITVIQKEVPVNFLGRFYSIFGTICSAAVPIGQIFFGFIFDKINTSYCLMISATIIFLSIFFLGKNLNAKENTLKTVITTT